MEWAAKGKKQQQKKATIMLTNLVALLFPFCSATRTIFVQSGRNQRI